MYTSVQQFFIELADSRAVYNRQNERLTGVLKLYADRYKTPRKANCLSLDRVIDHLAAEFIRLQAEHNIAIDMSREDIIRAIGSLQPTAGTGRKPHIVITTPKRRQFDAFRSEKQRHDDINAQGEFLGEFILADNERLPLLQVPTTNTVQ